jgi:hypothetical protein
MKGAQARLTETINFIVNAAPGNERTVVRNFVEAKVLQAHGGNRLHMEGISNPMSMNGLENRGTPDERKRRRSIMLMRLTYIQGRMGTTAMEGQTLGAPDVTTRFDEYLLATRLLASQSAHGDGALIQLKYNNLIGDPRAFLATNVVHCFGAGTYGAMQQYFWYEYMLGAGKYKFAAHMPGGSPNCHHPTVVNIPAVLWSQVPGRTNVRNAGTFANIRGTELTGGAVMVTTQFSGCTFCYKEHEGSIYAAHISPDDPNQQNVALGPGGGVANGGMRLARQLAGLEEGVTGGDFADPAPDGGDFMVYGAGYSNINNHDAGYPINQGGNYMTLIGKPQGGTWRFYSQHVNANGTVLRVVRIH